MCRCFLEIYINQLTHFSDPPTVQSGPCDTAAIFPALVTMETQWLFELPGQEASLAVSSVRTQHALRKHLMSGFVNRKGRFGFSSQL